MRIAISLQPLLNRGLKVLVLLLLSSMAVTAQSADSGKQIGIDRFLDQHWQRPLAPQGTPPGHFTDLERSLSPQACGSCHVPQFQDWSKSLHSKAMGPGLMGQLVEMSPHARGEHQACIRCHAPLAEQADQLVDEISNGSPPLAFNANQDTTNPLDNSNLHRKGLVCAACHVRNNQRFGPARKDGSTPDPSQKLPHDGWVSSDAYQDSQFCAACHQFEPNEFSLNGKLLENTYVEWQQSRYAEEGVSCQDCHMPDRKHQWRGIHDPETVKSGVTIKSELSSSSEQIQGLMTMTNTGTGHRFPTYVTPQVVMMAYQEDARGQLIDGSQRYFVVARRVPLNLSQEIFDTRLAPDETARLEYQQNRRPGATNLVIKVYVEPDKFYEGFYNSMLQSG
ncbi:MAG: ammonia-forming cytochrome c nitrite reductase subunit c552, partial [Motiliproteus sp.]|nr:ammonia-forming cytochrome c nitrite reductase subunit c552 [Motiliproteus sp.]